MIFTLEHVVLTFNGTNNFINNSAGLHGGGAIRARTNVTLTFNGTSDFSNNSAHSDNGGAICAETNVSLTFIGTSYFSINTAEFGGDVISILTMFNLLSMELAILLATQLIYCMVLVVQSMQTTTAH